MEAILVNRNASTPNTSAGSTSVTRAQKKRSWAGIGLSGLAVLFLVFDSAMKIAKAPPVLQAMQRTGFPEDTARPIGLILLACVVLYLVPRTAALGAVLLTGYLGGAVVTHMRLGDPLFSHTLFPIYFGILVWGGLYLRDSRVRWITPWAPKNDAVAAS